FSTINRVKVEVVSAYAKTNAGKAQIADALLQKNAIDAHDYVNVLQTGQLDFALEDEDTELINIRSENELLAIGQQPIVYPLDNHRRHAVAHKKVVDNPDVRQRPEVLEAVREHILGHLQAEQQLDPALLELCGLPPKPAPPPPPPGPGPGGPPHGPP